MQFKSLFILSSIVTLAVATDVGDILDDLSNVKISIVALDSTIKNDGLTLPALFTAIINDMDAVTSANDQTTANAQAVTPTPFSESDAIAVLGAVNDIRPIIEDALTQLVAKKSAFEDQHIIAGVIPTIEQGLVDLSASSAAVGVALLAATPADLLSQGSAAANEIGAAFATAVAAYSTS